MKSRTYSVATGSETVITRRPEGMTQEEYMQMMLSGGRSAEGNRYIGEDGDAQAHRQPQGQSHQKKDA